MNEEFTRSMIRGIRLDGDFVSADGHGKLVALRAQVEPQFIPFRSQAGVDHHLMVRGADSAEAEDGRHPSAAVGRGVRAAHKGGAHVNFVIRFQVDFGGF